MKQIWAARYLLDGDGKEDDIESAASFKTCVEKRPITTTFDDLGMLLTSLFPRLLLEETFWSSSVRSPLEEQLRTVMRTSYLQQIGIVPTDINLGRFVQNASLRGSSESTILIGLLLRRGMQVLDELNSMKTSSTDTKQTIVEEEKTKNLQTEEKHRNRLLELDNNLMTQKSEKTSLDALLENIRLSNRIEYLTRHIVSISQWLALIPETLDQVKDPPLALIPVTSFVRTTLIRIVFMNYLAVSTK
jgi:hypothetical protein